MDIYILRHGEAQARSPELDEAARRLTPVGKRDVRRVARAARRAKIHPNLILSSPLRRAVETANIAAKILGKPNIAETNNLLPGARPEKLWKEIAALKNVGSLLVAGHEPHLSGFAAYLLDADLAIDLKKGALLHIRTAASRGKPGGVLLALLPPRLAR